MAPFDFLNHKEYKILRKIKQFSYLVLNFPEEKEQGNERLQGGLHE